MVYIQPDRALRLLFQILRLGQDSRRELSIGFYPSCPPGVKCALARLRSAKCNCWRTEKKLSASHLENVSAVELRWNWMQGSSTFRQTLPISDNLSARTLRRGEDDPNGEPSKNCPLHLFLSKQTLLYPVAMNPTALLFCCIKH